MLYLILILVSLALFGGFLTLTAFEGAKNFRVLARVRDGLDTRVGRVSFIVRHVDWSAFIGHAVRTLLEHAAHEVAHASLLAVRALERLLTRAVRTLRTRRVERIPDSRTSPASNAPARLQGTVTYIKNTLRTTRRKAKPRVHVEAQDVTEVPIEEA